MLVETKLPDAGRQTTTSESPSSERRSPFSSSEGGPFVSPLDAIHESARLPTSSRRAIVVVGMHRSGTSALSGALGIFGGCLPKSLPPPNESNKKGFFESTKILEFHHRLLHSVGTTWFDWSKIPTAWYETAECEQFRHELKDIIAAEFDSSGAMIIKDPRICRIVPFWASVLDDLCIQTDYILPFRNPIEVARSLRTRNRINMYQSYLLWLRHLLDAEYHTRGSRRLVVDYSDLVRDEREVLSRVLESLNCVLPRQSEAVFGELSTFIDPDLRSSHCEKQYLSQRTDLSPWMIETYNCYRRLVEDPTDRAAMARLDSVRHAFEEACAVFSPAFHSQRGFLTTNNGVARQSSSPARSVYLKQADEVWVIFNDQRYHVSDANVYMDLFASNMIPPEAENISDISRGPDFNPGTCLVRCEKSNFIYLVTGVPGLSLRKHHIVHYKTFLQLCFDESRCRTVPELVLAGIANGAAIME
ncbi:sulfotransferase family protein [Methylobacterium frigidaeris]|uniref:Sulfotransferase family protein n=1 Tax=Methylobacterium frigidaeris TaxID=2038277 RepID=A0AA37HAX4_9HYPH|nr:hypothetical protein [Methylobacterium frigidaeris]GJD62338.1 hypothetical protein MPEAHAMD_2491 [Methylobacterium frigidaeris]